MELLLDRFSEKSIWEREKKHEMSCQGEELSDSDCYGSRCKESKTMTQTHAIFVKTNIHRWVQREIKEEKNSPVCGPLWAGEPWLFRATVMCHNGVVL